MKEKRCAKCGRLLAKEIEGELVIKNSKMEAAFYGGRARVVCPKCKSLEIIICPPKSASDGTA